VKRETLKRIFPTDKFEELMRLTYIDDMPHRFNDDDDSENALHEEGLNEIITSLFGDVNNDENNDHMVDNNNDSMGNYNQRNLDDNNLKDSFKQVVKTPMLRLGASRTSKLACTLILLELNSLFGWSDKGFTTLLTQVSLVGNPLSPRPSSFSGLKSQRLFQLLCREFLTHRYLLQRSPPSQFGKSAFTLSRTLFARSRAIQIPEPRSPMVNSQRPHPVGDFPIGKSARVMSLYPCATKL
jgi:hypothetical protein